MLHCFRNRVDRMGTSQFFVAT
uniref:Uncharacterized protein n=1 Tax=Anguilla anguilla TaxID=7936 RepID=A0A0E9R6G2_ANGAN